MRISPSPVDREDGGADYKRQRCEKPCYSLNAEGMSVDQCPFCEVRPSWEMAEIHCNDEC
jgi:hypothetical protein